MLHQELEHLAHESVPHKPYFVDHCKLEIRHIFSSSKHQTTTDQKISEMWLEEEDVHWVATSSLDTGEYRIQAINWQGR